MPGGYLLVSGGGGSDVREFERLAGLGYRAMDAGDHKDASRLLREALLLWTGPAFAGVLRTPRLETEARRLEESGCARWTSASKPTCAWAATANSWPN